MPYRTNHGLTERQLAAIKQILRPFAADIEKVALFGSRATGKYRPNSDIDLVLYGSVDEKTVDRLWTLFAESDLPYKVDVKSYEQITYPPFKQHIDEVSRILLTQKDLLGLSVS